jgi:hypothetical protein
LAATPAITKQPLTPYNGIFCPQVLIPQYFAGNLLDPTMSTIMDSASYEERAKKNVSRLRRGLEAPETDGAMPPSNELTSGRVEPSLEVDLFKADPTSGGVTASTEMLAAKRHAGVHTPVIACKTIIANQTMAYAA